MIIGITGYALSGKDTFANAIEHELQPLTVCTMHLADRLKEAGRILGWDGTKLPTDSGRFFLQKFGQGMKDLFGQTFWVDLLLVDIGVQLQQKKNIVVADVRFDFEADALRDFAFRMKLPVLIVRMNRPGIEPFNNHVSETEVDKIIPDVTIENDGLIVDLYPKAQEILKHFYPKSKETLPPWRP